ncbi:hypothetical protein [Actinophytocola oryzae]|uniref:hypothetical protein n=1 Tax=Actinophytocola oryzae TaxID=502181 RepID=UPI001062A08A|nr:hypothetical protein [Actinophytocola oryzae]
MTTDQVPSVQVQTGSGVDPGAIDHALVQLRAVCAGHQVESVRARLTRTATPGGPSTVTGDATAVVRGRSVRVGGTGHCPRASIDQLCDRLAARLQALATPNRGSVTESTKARITRYSM